MSITPAKLPALNTSCWGLAAHRFQLHSVNPPSNYDKAALEDPATWAHLRTKFRTFDEIRAIAEDGSWYALLTVVYAQDGVVRIKELWRIPLDIAGTIAAAGQTRYVVKQLGNQGWCVVDTEDGGRKIRQGLAKKSDAEKQLEDHLLAMSR